MIEGAIFIIIIMLSVILHEVGHGYSAYLLGDPTAKNEGRLTLNPVPHIDLFGTVLLPAFLLFFSNFIFGWAKPVPYNPYNLRGRFAEVIVAAAGPLTNVGIAVVAAGVIRFWSGMPEPFAALLLTVIFINLFLALLNLLPIPPLDGAKIVSSLLPARCRLMLERRFEPFLHMNNIALTILTLILIAFFLLGPISSAVNAMTAFLVNTHVPAAVGTVESA